MARRDNILVSRSLYQIGLVTLLASIVWVVISAYLTITKSVTVEVDKSLIEPLVTKLDMEVIDQLTTRLKIEGEVNVETESVSLEENEFIN